MAGSSMVNYENFGWAEKGYGEISEWCLESAKKGLGKWREVKAQGQAFVAAMVDCRGTA